MLCAAVALTGLTAAPGPERPGRFVYVANLHSDTVSVVDPRAGTVVDGVPVGDGPDSVALGPDGSRLYVTDSAADTVSVVDTRTRTVVETVAVGHEPSRVTVSPDNRSVYVSNVGAGTVSVISTRTLTVTDTITVGDAPWAWRSHPTDARCTSPPPAPTASR